MCLFFIYIINYQQSSKKQVGRSTYTHQWMHLFTKLCTRTCMEINSLTGEEKKTSIYTP